MIKVSFVSKDRDVQACKKQIKGFNIPEDIVCVTQTHTHTSVKELF